MDDGGGEGGLKLKGVLKKGPTKTTRISKHVHFDADCILASRIVRERLDDEAVAVDGHSDTEDDGDYEPTEDDDDKDEYNEFDQPSETDETDEADPFVASAYISHYDEDDEEDSESDSDDIAQLNKIRNERIIISDNDDDDDATADTSDPTTLRQPSTSAYPPSICSLRVPTPIRQRAIVTKLLDPTTISIKYLQQQQHDGLQDKLNDQNKRANTRQLFSGVGSTQEPALKKRCLAVGQNNGRRITTSLKKKSAL